MNDNDQSANVANGSNRIANWMLRRLIIFSLVAVGGLYMFSFSGRVPENIGAADGKSAASDVYKRQMRNKPFRS